MPAYKTMEVRIVAHASNTHQFGLAGLVQAGAAAVPGGFALCLGASAMLIPLGWLPGTARKAWSRPHPNL